MSFPTALTDIIPRRGSRGKIYISAKIIKKLYLTKKIIKFATKITSKIS